MTPRPHTNLRNPQIIAGGFVAGLSLLVVAGFGVRRLTADPLEGRWTRQVTTRWNTEQWELITFSTDHTGTLITTVGDPAHLDNRPDFFHYQDIFEWHKGGAQIAMQYRVPAGQNPKTTQFSNTGTSYGYTISDDGAMLTLTGFNDGNGGDDGTVAPPAVFTRQ